jgi:dCTP deaminase
VILSGREIRRRLGRDIDIDPFDERQLNPNSYNLRLHDRLLRYDEEILDMARPNRYDEIGIPAEGIVLEPMLEGRSSIGRLGLFVHVTAGFGDVGFSGYWTLEIFCVQPIRIYAGVQICQIYYHTLEGDYDPYRSGKYQNNRGVQPSMLYKEFAER